MRTIKGEMPMTDMASKMLPSFSLTAKDLPAIRNWQVGKKYKLEIEVEQVSLSKDEYSKSVEARFKIHKVGEKELMSEEEKQAKLGHY